MIPSSTLLNSLRQKSLEPLSGKGTTCHQVHFAATQLSVGLTSRVQFPSYLIIQMVNSAPFPTLWWFGVSFVNFMLKRERHTPGCQVLLVSVTDSDSVLTVLTLSWGWVTPSPHPPSPVFVGVTLLVPWWVHQCLLRCCLAPPRFSPRIPGCSLLCVLEGLI